MDDIDYVLNALQRRDVTLRFVPEDQCDLHRMALDRLKQDGHRVCRISLLDVETEIELLRRISAATSSPWVSTNWGAFEDWMNQLSFLLTKGRGCFLSMENGLSFWQRHTSIAGTLSNEIQSIASSWRDRSSVAGGVLKNEIESKFPEWARPDIYLAGLYELR
jgi:hypothetical protein